MNKNQLKKYRLLIVVFVVALFIWFLVVSPLISFHKNESTMVDAAKRYYELNKEKLPIGERVRTLSLKELYDEAYIKEDFKAPYSSKMCSTEKSWIKVTKVNGEYKYYAYLDCGILKSSVDHKGPKIKLNGDSEMTLHVGDKFKDPGVKSVTDNTDGKMDVKSVTVKSDVDTNNIGTYEVNYIALDSLNNKTVETRTVKVVKVISDTVKKQLNKDTYYKGSSPNNYIYFSNVLFRILNVDGDNVRIVSESDVSNVDFTSIDDWFDYYDSYITDSAQKIIVNNKYCNMGLDEKNLNSTKCSSFTKKKKYGLLSITDINNTMEDGESYLVGSTITWTANENGKNNAYAFRRMFADTESIYYSFEKKHNFGVRPVITIKGDTLIVDGDGSSENPYVMTDYIKLEKNTMLNERYVGEYFKYSDYLWRIQNIENDGSIKAISEQTVYDDLMPVQVNYDDSIKKKIYNPTEKGNVGYKINNITSKYLDTSYLVNHSVKVPIYKGEPKYKSESDTKSYKMKITSPNMYDLYSAVSSNSYTKSYWLINSSKSEREVPGISDTGSVMYGEGSMNYSYGIRPVAYFDKKIAVTNGKGTMEEPFTIKK